MLIACETAASSCHSQRVAFIYYYNFSPFFAVIFFFFGFSPSHYPPPPLSCALFSHLHSANNAAQQGTPTSLHISVCVWVCVSAITCVSCCMCVCVCVRGTTLTARAGSRAPSKWEQFLQFRWLCKVNANLSHPQPRVFKLC